MYTANQPRTMIFTVVDQSSAQKIADMYLVETFGRYFSPNHGVLIQTAWRFLIQYQLPTMSRAIIVGRIDINLHSGAPVFLSPAEIALIQERCTLLTADLDGVLPVDATGQISPYLAKRNVKAYLGHYISIFAQPADNTPEWIAGEPSYWRVNIILRQHDPVRQLALGWIDVNPTTGEVVPLTELQLKMMQRRLQNASADSPSPTRATG